MNTIKTRLHTTLAKCKNYLLKRLDEDQFLYSIRPWNKRNVYVIGTPLHSNVGDNAIALAEIEYLKALGIPDNNIKEITVDEYKKYCHRFKNILARKGQLILLHGGGNMGNQWLIEELLRRDIMTDLPDNPMVIFPQTFSYSDDDEGNSELEKSIPYYNDRKNLTITAREQTSYDGIIKAYPNADNILTPDIVLSLDPSFFTLDRSKRDGLLFVLRMDGERTLSDKERDFLIKQSSELFDHISFTDMHSELPISKTSRKQLIEEKINTLSTAKVVITDRLHGMVLCAISNTPCIVMRNNNHKINGTYDWLKHLPYVSFVDSVDEAVSELKCMNLDQVYTYNYAKQSQLFEPLALAIKKYLSLKNN